MILGNKCDMEDKRVVSKERGEGIAREHNISFLETSAKVLICTRISLGLEFTIQYFPFLRPGPGLL